MLLWSANGHVWGHTAVGSGGGAVGDESVGRPVLVLVDVEVQTLHYMYYNFARQHKTLATHTHGLRRWRRRRRSRLGLTEIAELAD